MRLIWLAVPLLVTATSRETLAGPGTPIHPESRLWITGASNIRHFTCQARQIGGTLELRGLPTHDSVLSGENASLEPSLRISVAHLDCGVGVMNRHLRDALHAPQYPVVEFRLATYDVDLVAATPVVRMVGQVTIGGVQRPVALTATIQADSLGRLHVRGTHAVRMTEFGIRPPRRFGGLLRVRDRIVVHFDVVPGADGGTVDRIRCSLAPHTEPEHKPGATHASHS